MGLFNKKDKNKTVSKENLKYKVIPMSPELQERQYEEENYKKYGINKRHKFTST